VRLYDHLFTKTDPDNVEEGQILQHKPTDFNPPGGLSLPGAAGQPLSI
jgi:hypothetical protein